MSNIKQPTADQCNTSAEIETPYGYDPRHWRAFAYWYPQMGGYTSRSVLVIPREADGCFEAYIWHDGSFPFSEDEGNPAHIHHCVAEQFIELGEFVSGKLSLRPESKEGENHG